MIAISPAIAASLGEAPKGFGVAACFPCGDLCSLTSFARAGDESRGGAIGDIGPKPTYGDGDAVTKAQQKQDVNQTPEPPCSGAMQPDEAEVGNCRFTADGR